MTRRGHNNDTRPRSATTVGRSGEWQVGGILELGLLFLLLALFPLRAVVSETHTFELPATFRSLEATGTAGPATTFAITTLILASAGTLLTIRLARGGPAWRWTGAEPGMALLAVGMIVSTLRAGQKHLAVIGSLDFLGVLVYLLILRQLLNRPWRIRLALTVVMATGAIVVTKCAYQRFVELPETIRYYQEHRAELLAGADETNAGFIHDYEQRLRSGAVTGFFAHPNLLASFLILIIMTTLGILADRLRRLAGPSDVGGRGEMGGRGSRRAYSLIVPAIIAAGATLMLVWAQSKGAALALGIAVMLWIFGTLLRPVISRRPRTAWISLWLLLLVGAASLVGTLRARPNALGLSMLYRSMYWQAAARMVADQGPWGVGADNFGRFFTRYKDVECPEDVEDPHSWVMKSLCEWGVPGLLGLLLIFGGLSWKLASIASGLDPAAPEGRPTMAQGASPGTTGGSKNQAPQGRQIPPRFNAHTDSPALTSSIILSSMFIGAIFFCLWFGILADASPAFILITLHLPLIAWFAAFILGGLETAGDRHFPDDEIGLTVTTAVAAGLIGFLIHSGIDLALFHGGAATTFFALCAVLLAGHSTGANAPSMGRENPHEAPRTTASRRDGLAPALKRIIIPALLAGIVSLCAASLTVGSYLYGSNLAEARRFSHRMPPTWAGLDSDQSYHAYHTASVLYPLDGTAIEESCGLLSSRVRQADEVNEVIQRVNNFQRRDPHNALVWQHLSTLYYQRFELARRAVASQSAIRDPKSELAHADLDESIACMRNAVAAYPTSPNRRLQLADLLEKRAEFTNLPDDRRAVADQLQTALDLDAKRIYISKPHRLSDRACSQIRLKIADLSH